MSLFSLRVLRERARLALADPVGELEAVVPLSHEQARVNMLLADEELRRREQAAPTEGSPTLEDGLGLPASPDRGLVPCPAHDDRRRSLSWRRMPDGFLRLHCFAGCTFDEIRKAVLG